MYDATSGLVYKYIIFIIVYCSLYQWLLGDGYCFYTGLLLTDPKRIDTDGALV